MTYLSYLGLLLLAALLATRVGVNVELDEEHEEGEDVAEVELGDGRGEGLAVAHDHVDGLVAVAHSQGGQGATTTRGEQAVEAARRWRACVPSVSPGRSW